MDVRETRRLFIDGQLTDATSGETFATENPATGRPLATVQMASVADVDRAVDAARVGFRAWSARTGLERGQVLRRAAQLLRDRTEDLARLETLDSGKPITEARTIDIPSAADCLDYFAGLSAAHNGEHVALPGGAFAYTRREPLGVCAALGAWSHPLQTACWKAAPALACGNAVVLKPSALTPLSALELAAIFGAAGLPPGAFNVVHGGEAVGEALCTHTDVAQVALTGSVPAGRQVMASAAPTLKHVSLELGGKSALVVFADADLEQAVTGAMLANFRTQGEVRASGARVFVHRKVLDEFLARLVPRVKALRIGDPLDPATRVGALISRAHRDAVLGHVEAGRAGGARLLCGGAPPAWDERQAALRGGHFVLPAIFDRCQDEMPLVRDEIFGPVMAVLAFDDEDEVIIRANGLSYGLGAGVFTRDLACAHRLAARLEAGMVWINNYNVTPVEVPFGGVKQSGIGRENGKAALEHYSQLKTVYVELGKIDSPF